MLTLDTVFKRLYDQYNEESDHRTAMLSSMLEPLLIGGLVAVILIAMYLPMFRLSNTLMGSEEMQVILRSAIFNLKKMCKNL
jgi:type IV pilus assembly protein PilC